MDTCLTLEVLGGVLEPDLENCAPACEDVSATLSFRGGGGGGMLTTEGGCIIVPGAGGGGKP